MPNARQTDAMIRDLAFPSVVPPACRDGQDIPYGLTKRELFAALAMQGILVNLDRASTEYLYVAADAVRCADALLAALIKGGDEK